MFLATTFPKALVRAAGAGTGFVTTSKGLGDDTGADTSSSELLGGSFLGGSLLTSFVIGLGIIIAVKTVLAPSRSSSPPKKWAAGAWRDLDYEDPNQELFTDKELKKLLRKNRTAPTGRRPVVRVIWRRQRSRSRYARRSH